MKRILLALALCLLPFPGYAQGKPNIIIILADDLPATIPLARYPNIQGIQANGVEFSNSLVDFSLCAPSRASFLTGLAAHNHGIKSNRPGGWAAYKSFEANSLPVWLQAAGYETALLGKYINRYQPSVVPPGWTKWFGAKGNAKYFNADFNDNGAQITESAYSTDALAREAAEFINAAQQPFFMLVTPKAPHSGDGHSGLVQSAPRHATAPATNAPRPPSFNESDVSDKPAWVKALASISGDQISTIDSNYRSAHRAMLSLDEMVGSIVSALGPKLANTYICLTSDNGFFYGEHRIRIGKVYPYEPSLRVPLICRGPGIPAGEVRNQIVNNLDLSATVMDWADATPGRTLDGRSFASVLADAQAAWRDAIFFSADSAIAATEIQATGVRMPSRKYVKWGDGFEELYDLVSDPNEIANKAGDANYAADLTALRALHSRLATCSGSSCWVGAEASPGSR
jgi:arylsulfatase A-like enzyme